MSAKKIVKKKVATKKKVVKKKRVSKKGPEMVSYAIKMVIPTGDYANIQPEIVVRAGNPDEAHAFIAPHMNKLWKEYFNISKRKVEPEKKPVVTVPTPPIPTTVTPGVSVTPAPIATVNPVPITTVPTPMTTPSTTVTPDPVPEPSPVSSVALTKATQAIQSCLSLEALDLIINQVKVSVKLTDQDKIDLAGVIMEKENELKEAILTSENEK